MMSGHNATIADIVVIARSSDAQKIAKKSNTIENGYIPKKT